MTKLLTVVVLAILVIAQALAAPNYGYRYRRPRYYSAYPSRAIGYGYGPGSLAVHGTPYYGGFGLGGGTYVAQNPGAVHIVHGVFG